MPTTGCGPGRRGSSTGTGRWAESSATLTSTDQEAGLSVRWEAEVTEEGLVRVRSTVTNVQSEPYYVGALRTTLPVAADATELLDLTGRWCRERTPQRHPWPHGAWVRAGRHGRTGHDATLRDGRGDPWVRVPVRAGVGRPPRLERRPRHLCGAHPRGGVPAGGSRAPRSRRGRARARTSRTPARGWSAPSPTGASTDSATGCTAGSGGTPRAPAPHVRWWSTPGRRPTSTTTCPGWPRWRTWRPRSGPSGSSSTTVGSPGDATTGPGWGTGPWTGRSGRRGSIRWSTTCGRSAWGSGCGSSRRWSTRTPSWPGLIPTGSCADAESFRTRGVTSRCWTSSTLRPTPTCATRCSRCWTSTPSSS